MNYELLRVVPGYNPWNPVSAGGGGAGGGGFSASWVCVSSGGNGGQGGGSGSSGSTYSSGSPGSAGGGGGSGSRMRGYHTAAVIYDELKDFTAPTRSAMSFQPLVQQPAYSWSDFTRLDFARHALIGLSVYRPADLLKISGV